MKKIRKIVNNGIIESYWIEQYESGIIQLLFNTSSKWIEYSRLNNNTYCFYESIEAIEQFRLEIPELKIPSNYLATESQNKDQIFFYFIPMELITSGKIRQKILEKRKL